MQKYGIFQNFFGNLAILTKKVTETVITQCYYSGSICELSGASARADEIPEADHAGSAFS